jgi:hypothetical protein
MTPAMNTTLVISLFLLLIGTNTFAQAQPILTQITGEGTCSPIENQNPTPSAPVPAAASESPDIAAEPADKPRAAANVLQQSAEPASPPTAPRSRPPASQRAQVKLIQTAFGQRVLEVVNEYIEARGLAVQVQYKDSGEVGYFLDYGSAGSISVIFNVDDSGKVRARLVIVDDRYPGHRYEYICRKESS